MQMRHTADIRQANALACIQALRSSTQPMTISDVASQTSLSRTTIDAVLEDLEAEGLILASQAVDDAPRSGRPARRYQFNARQAVVAGIDAGPRNLRVLISDLTGSVLSTATEAFPENVSGEQRVEMISQIVTRALAEAEVSPDRLGSACVAVSGIIGADGRIANSFAVPEWNRAPIAEDLSEMLGCEVSLENDIKLAALAEHHMGSARDVDNILFVQIGNRISVALTFDRQIFQGKHRIAGEIGSLRGMRWASNSVRGVLTWRTGESAYEVMLRAERGDPEALAEVRTFVEDIAPLLTTIALAVDPGRIVVGGGLSRAPTLFIDMLRERIAYLTMLEVTHEVRSSSLGSLGAACGALALAFQAGSEVLFGVSGVEVPRIALPS